MFARTFYIRLEDRRIRIDATGASSGYDEVAAVALKDASSKEARIEAIGKAAEALRGNPQFTVIYPFAHPRMLFGDFTIAERLVVMAMRAFHKQQDGLFFRPLVMAIVHPLRVLEGGLTQIEVRALRELIENSGARKVAIHTGRELSPKEIESYADWQT